jgi:DUF1680 family protein
LVAEVTMSDAPGASRLLSRRALLGGAGPAAASAALVHSAEQSSAETPARPFPPVLTADAGVDRVAVLPGKTYLRGWVGSGRAPATTRPLNGARRESSEHAAPHPQLRIRWSKVSGPGRVSFDDPAALVTAAAFSAPGDYVLRLEAAWPAGKAASTVNVTVEPPPPGPPLEAVQVTDFRISSRFWKPRLRNLIANWIPHCIRQINRRDLEVGLGGIDNFIEAGKKLRGEAHGLHKGYVFSNAWVLQTIESMSLALMYDAEGDPEAARAQKQMRRTLEEWIPIVLAAQEPDGYLQTAFTLPRLARDGKVIPSDTFEHWDPAHRRDHEGYVAGYFLEAAIAHHRMSGGKDDRLYRAARRLADCWDRNLGPPPKRAWFDEHQGMEQALVAFGRYVDEVEGKGEGARYLQLAKFLLDSRYHASAGPHDRSEYCQSHLPVVEQYEAVGHAVRAAYTYSAMADIAIETGDPDYRSAVKSLWASITHRKLYLTGGIGSGETPEGFGPDYSLPSRGYCESCASCGELFFQWKMGRLYRDARFADLLEDTLYNALAGSLDLDCRHYYYDNPLEERLARYRWHACPCCVGNIPRTLLMLPVFMYAWSPDGLFVNLFAASRVRIAGVAGGDVELVQQTDYPWNGRVTLTVSPARAKRFRLAIRIPNRNVSRLYRAAPELDRPPLFRINGSPARPAVENGYAVFERTWKPADRVEFELPLRPQRVRPDGRIRALRGKVALRYGPLIYNLEDREQRLDQALPAGASITAEWREELLGGVVVLRSRFEDNSPLTAIPHYARMNREPATEYPPQPAAAPPRSVVWIEEAPQRPAGGA